jgi:hypothetical protein
MYKRIAIGFVALLALTLAGARTFAGGAKPEDVFKGRIIVTKKPLPLRFGSAGAFISAVNSSKIDKLWPVSEDGEKGEWKVEYIAFFAQPLNDNEIQVKFYDITAGKKYVAGDAQYTNQRGSRIFSSSITLAKPEFDVRKHYMMTAESRGRIIATTTFWLLGKGQNYSGKVEFSDEDAKGH